MKKPLSILAACLLALSVTALPLSASAEEEMKIPGGAGQGFGGIYPGSTNVAHIVTNCDTGTTDIGASEGLTFTLQSEVARSGSAWKLAAQEGVANWSIWADNDLGWVALGGDSSTPYMDLSGHDLEDLVFSFWIRMDNAAYSDGSIDFQFTSVNGDKQQTLSWTRWYGEMGFSAEKLGQWMHVELPFSEAQDPNDGYTKWADKTGDDALDLAHIKKFRMENKTGSGYTVYLDDLYFLDKSVTVTPGASDGLADAKLPEGGRSNVISAADSLTEESKWTINTENKTEGTGSVSYTFQGEEVGSMASLFLSSDDGTSLAQFKNADQAYLVFDLYIEDASVVDMSQFQVQTYYNLGIGANDAMNMTWWVKNLYDGWNRLVLPFNSSVTTAKLGYADATLHGTGATYVADGGATMFAGANCLRLLMKMTEEATILVDNVSVYSVGADPVIDFEPKVTDVSIDVSDVKTEYVIGEKLDTTGLKVTATYDDGTTEDVTAEAEIDASAFDSSKEGAYEIQVSYGDATKTFEVVVKTEWEQEPDPDGSTPDGGASEPEENVQTGVAGSGAVAALAVLAAGTLLAVSRKRKSR